MLELRTVLRGLRQRPGYAAACVATLTLVIGVNAALFAAINVTMFRPIGLRDGERTVSLYLMPPGLSDRRDRNPLHALDLVRLRERSRTMTGIAGFTQVDRVLGTGDEPAVISTIAASAELLRKAPVGPILGRTFTDDEETRKERLAVLSYGAWQRRFGGDPAIVGRSISLDAEPYTVIGVMPRTFPPKFLETECWTPLGIRTGAVDEGRTYVVTIAQLAAGARLEDADTEMRAIVADLARELPRTHDRWTGGVITFRDWQYGNFQTPLLVLFVAVVVLLLIASANVASLTLARVAARADELALRRAIGATRWDVARLVLIELAIVNAIGSAGGLIAGSWLRPALLTIAPATTGALGAVAMDWRVALYAIGCALVSSAVAGVVPAMSASDAAPAVRASSRRLTVTREGRRWRAFLLAAQTGLCVALLVSGGLLVRALLRTSRIAPGYDAEHVLTAQLQLPPSRYANGPERAAAMARVFERIGAIPGVVMAGATMNRFTPGFSYQTMTEAENQSPSAGRQGQQTVQFRRVSPTYFSLMRIRLNRGRVFGPQDSLTTPAVAVVSQSFADRFWPAQDPIGRRVRRGTGWATVIGVVADVSDVDLLQPPQPTLYSAWLQTANVAFPMGLVVRTEREPQEYARALRAAVASVDPLLALDRIQSLDTFLADSLAPQRFRATLMLGLAIVGLLLGATGIAGVTARTVAERLPEFGVRLALGCDGAELWRRAIVDQVRVVGIGAAAGTALAIGAGRVLASMLPETAGTDGAVLAGAIGLLVSIAAIAAAIPAAKVLRLSPVAVLCKE